MWNRKKTNDDSGLKADDNLERCHFTLKNPFNLPVKIFPLTAEVNDQTIRCYSGWDHTLLIFLFSITGMQTLSVPFSSDDSALTKFDPGNYLSRAVINSLWTCLFSRDPGLGLCNDSELISKAVSSALSFIFSLEYCESRYIWLTVTDPRFL
jgi:hypothetical protein